MEREEKVRGREREKQEVVLGVKLKRGIVVGKRGSTSTPSPTWRFGLYQSDGSLLEDFNFPSNYNATATFSARKLCANLWETQPQPRLKVIKMNKNGATRPHHLHHHRRGNNSVELLSKLAESHDSPSEEPTNEDSLGKRFTESPKQHHHSNERNGCNLQPSSVASYSSSMEMAPYHPPITRTSSLKLNGGFGESSYSLKTSTELLKVLNRIWSLEEQHASNMSLVKGLKKELVHSQTQIKELLQEKQRDQREIDYLKNKMAEVKVSGKCKEQDRIKDVIQSLRNELEDERKLRKHSEILHRKLARELSKINSSFTNGLKELEKERKARVLLEELCDEFALGIIEYEQEVRLLRQKKKNDPIAREHSDRLILHLSEAWMDGRMQMKQAELRSDLAEKKSVVEKLSCEIETFLQAKHTGISRNHGSPCLKDPSRNNLCRHYLESIHLNEAANTPRRNEAPSTSYDLNNDELNRGSFVKQVNGWSKELAEHAEKSHVEKGKSNPMKKKVQPIKVLKEVDLSNLQLQFEECISADVADCKTEIVNPEGAEMGTENLAKVHSSQKMDTSELKQEGLQEKKDIEIDKQINLQSSLPRTKSLPAEVKQIQYESIHVEDTFDPTKFTGPVSPVEKWTTVAAPDPEISEAALKQPQNIKENTLRAKLLEARLESRLRTSKGFSQADQGKG